jgi:hypothetical protein
MVPQQVQLVLGLQEQQLVLLQALVEEWVLAQKLAQLQQVQHLFRNPK